ncbi:MAG: dihydroneopterin aldolase [Mariprofundaceae bacterium]
MNKAMDKVLIEGLEIRTVIGIYDWEREIRQMVKIDLEMDWDIKKAALSDDISDTLDYKAVSKRLISFVETSSFGLIEALAESCAKIVLEEFSVPWLRLKMSKPGAVRGSENVAVVIERSR